MPSWNLIKIGLLIIILLGCLEVAKTRSLRRGIREMGLALFSGLAIGGAVYAAILIMDAIEIYCS